MTKRDIAARRGQLLAAVSILGVSLGMSAPASAAPDSPAGPTGGSNLQGEPASQHKGDVAQHKVTANQQKATTFLKIDAANANQLKIESTQQKVDDSNQHKITAPTAGPAAGGAQPQ